MGALGSGCGLGGRLTHGCSGGRMMSGWTLSRFWPMDVAVMVLAHGRSGERMRSGWTLSWFWPVDALGNG